MKRFFFFALLTAVTLSLSAQYKMQIWEGNLYTEFLIAAVDSVTSLSTPAGTPKPIDIVSDTIVREVHDTLYVRVCPDDQVLSGAFSVSADKQVRFAKGNLRYIQSSAKWYFAENQYDMFGAANVGNEQLADTIDLFGWSTLTGKAIWGISTSTDSSDYSGTFVDWGLNMGSGTAYRTLTFDEWNYLLFERTDNYFKYGVACIRLNDKEFVNGLILLPDSWTCPADISFNRGTNSDLFPSVEGYAAHNTYSLSQWQQLEAAGAVFLPASGYREGTSVEDVQEFGGYWSATVSSVKGDALCTYFYSNKMFANLDDPRRDGKAVRLVKDL